MALTLNFPPFSLHYPIIPLRLPYFFFLNPLSHRLNSQKRSMLRCLGIYIYPYLPTLAFTPIFVLAPITVPMRVCSVAQSCMTLCDAMDCSPPGSSVHGIPQARILEWVAISSSRGSSGPRDRTRISCIHPLYWQVDSLPLSYLGSPTCTYTCT